MGTVASLQARLHLVLSAHPHCALRVRAPCCTPTPLTLRGGCARSLHAWQNKPSAHSC